MIKIIKKKKNNNNNNKIIKIIITYLGGYPGHSTVVLAHKYKTDTTTHKYSRK